jgi:hypothetical protein
MIDFYLNVVSSGKTSIKNKKLPLPKKHQISADILQK